MIKLTEDDIQCESLVSDTLAMKTVIIQYFGKPEDGKELKQQILDDYEKARILDKLTEILDKLGMDSPQQHSENQKLRELIEKRQDKWKKASRMSDEQMYTFNEIQKLLEESKK